MNDNLLSESELLSWLGYSRRKDAEDRLRQLGVPIIYGRGGRLCTTLDALNAALGVRSPVKSAPEHPRFV